uniref:Membrane-anchored androgenic gland specific factor n=1 Tax=Cherax quadricarinatus TaxID=27406 RepID=K7S3H3_CHEQU|nr:uncharacterized protein LOC128700217 [Cherax quadricarinatus]XP_053649252.1 uncharacterized protein LOC128700217 [Cherax quadricarinatus]AFV93996.1 membrane-anchored androgenic gland specific factor [Cherax quadricarinatus]
MVCRRQQQQQQQQQQQLGSSSCSLTWFLVVLVSLVLVVQVQTYPGYGDRLRNGRRYQGQQLPLSGTTPADDYLDDDLDYSSLYDHDPFSPKREPELYTFDQTEDSNKNLQQILRSFRPVVGGTAPSDRVIPWRKMEEAALEELTEGMEATDRYPAATGAHLTQLSFSEPKQKREASWPCILWVKFCPLG